jgi:hypothetical protein
LGSVRTTNDNEAMETTIEATTETEPVRFPKTELLAQSIRHYQLAGEEAAALEAKLARMEIDEEAILSDTTADEDEQCQRLAEVRTKKDVTARRTSHKRLEVSRLLNELEESFSPAESEVRTAHGLEVSRRREILTDRVKAVLGLADDDWVALDWVCKTVALASPIVALNDCGPNPNAAFVRSVEQRANDLLETVKRLETEIGKKI